MVNQHGIDISYELGHKINTALFEGDTSMLFALIANYLEDNELEIPESDKIKRHVEVLSQDCGVLLR